MFVLLRPSAETSQPLLSLCALSTHLLGFIYLPGQKQSPGGLQHLMSAFKGPSAAGRFCCNEGWRTHLGPQVRQEELTPQSQIAHLLCKKRIWGTEGRSVLSHQLRPSLAQEVQQDLCVGHGDLQPLKNRRVKNPTKARGETEISI